MSMLWKFAWRNIWRNKARTALLLASMSVGLTGILLMMGLIRGWIDSMRDASVNTFAGHVKIMADGFYQNPSVDRTYILNTDMLDENNGTKKAPRIALQGMLSTPRHARIVQLVGIEPSRERGVSVIADSVVEGAFLQNDGSDLVLIGQSLAERLELKVGKKIVLTAAQPGGQIGAAAMRIGGVFDTGQKGFDETHVYMLIQDAATLFNISNRVTEVVMIAPGISQSGPLAASVQAEIVDPNLQVLHWTDRLPLVTESMKYVDQSMFIYYLVFYAAMAFGIVNTLLMSIGERTREIGMMMAVGMRRKRIVGMIMLESVMIGILAVLCGSLLGGSILAYFAHHGIDLSSLADAADYAGIGRMLYPGSLPADFFTGGWITLVITVLFSLYPAWRASRLLPVEALRQT